MKKILITEEQYKTINNFVNEQVNDNRYHYEVQVEVDYHGKISHLIDHITCPKINVNYLIEAEYRSWGIKDISLYDIKGPSEVELEVSYYPQEGADDVETKTVRVSLNWELVERDDDPGHQVIRVGDEITLHLSEDANGELHCSQISVPVYTL